MPCRNGGCVLCFMFFPRDGVTACRFPRFCGVTAAAASPRVMDMLATDNNLTGAQMLVKALEREGVELIFAYPGSTSMLVHQCLLDSPIRVVLPRHEQGGGFAAEGYARASGKVGVCMATSGPGATNLVTAIADAWMDSVPLVAVTCQVNQHLIGKNAFQETDIIGMTRPCVKHSQLVLHPEEVATAVKDAFYLASHGRPGPVVVDIPTDVLRASCRAVFPAALGVREPSCGKDEIDGEELAQLRRLFREARRPCIYAGGGIINAGAASLLREFAEKYDIPVATSLMGIGGFPEDHPLSLKFLGMHGSYAANYTVRECDLLIALCVRFSDRVTGDIKRFAPLATILHVDIDASEINKNKRADFSCVCDVRVFLEAMLREPFRCGTDEWRQRVAEWKRDFPFQFTTGGDNITVPEVITTLQRLTCGNATVVTGVGQHQIWTAQFFSFRKPRHFLTSGGLGAMGFGLPAAIGAGLALRSDADRRREPVVLLDGDGSFQMNIQELATLYAEEVPVKMIVLNNQNLGMVSQWEDRFFNGRHANTDLRIPRANGFYPDFCAVAAAYGIAAAEVSQAGELSPALEKMLRYDGAYLLNVHTVRHNHVLPMIPAGKTCEDAILE